MTNAATGLRSECVLRLRVVIEITVEITWPWGESGVWVTAMSEPAPAAKRDRTNVRRPDVMELVSAEVAVHFHSSIVEKLRDRGGD